MRPTHFGVKSLLFFTAITGSFYAAPYVNLFFLLVAFFAAHWVLGAWWTYANLRGIEATIEDPGPIQAGTRGRVEWSVVGESRRFGLSLNLEFESGAKGTGGLAFTGGKHNANNYPLRASAGRRRAPRPAPAPHPARPPALQAAPSFRSGRGVRG